MNRQSIDAIIADAINIITRSLGDYEDIASLSPEERAQALYGIAIRFSAATVIGIGAKAAMDKEELCSQIDLMAAASKALVRNNYTGN